MSRTASRRLLAQSPLTSLSEPFNPSKLSLRCLRSFSSTVQRGAEEDDARPPPTSSRLSFPSMTNPQNPIHTLSPSLNPKAAGIKGLASSFDKMVSSRNKKIRASRPTLLDIGSLSSDGTDDGNLIQTYKEISHQIYVYSTRHNVHITVVRPPGFVNEKTGLVSKNRTVAMSYSTGNLGFRKSNRKHYDSAFQLAAYVLGKMQDSGLSGQIRELEVYLRGFGNGREAVTKALLGTEGARLRGKIVKVADNTRLKFGGTRSKKPRRLG